MFLTGDSVAYRSSRRSRPGAATCLAVLLAAFWWSDHVVTQTASGADVKAAFLLNFAKFVQWPAGGQPDQPFVIGVLGDNTVAYALRDLSRGKSVGRRPLNVRSVTSDGALTDLQILFVGAIDEPRLAAVLHRASAGSVLTVSDLDRFCELGGIIQLLSERDRFRFEINLDQAERSRLVINSKLLALAKTVYHTTKAPGGSR